MTTFDEVMYIRRTVCYIECTTDDYVYSCLSEAEQIS